MKRLFVEIFILILLAMTLIYIFWPNKDAIVQHHIIPTPPTPMGNKLVSYFYYINTHTNEYLIEEHKNDMRILKNSALSEFYSKLQWQPQDNVINFKSEPRAAWQQLNQDGTHKENFLEFWQTVRLQSRKLYHSNITYNSIEVPVVHFRCSDSPFNKHNRYHMTKASTVQWMAEQIRKRGFTELIILNCNDHGSLDQNSCAKYVNFYTQIFNESGISVSEQCNSVIQDFAMMVYTPLLVTLNASSLSFMAGISKDPQDYISCNMGLEKTDGEYVLQTQADWILSNDKPILHKDVADYNDTEDVIKRLLK